MLRAKAISCKKGVKDMRRGRKTSLGGRFLAIVLAMAMVFQQAGITTLAEELATDSSTEEIGSEALEVVSDDGADTSADVTVTSGQTDASEDDTATAGEADSASAGETRPDEEESDDTAASGDADAEEAQTEDVMETSLETEAEESEDTTGAETEDVTEAASDIEGDDADAAEDEEAEDDADAAEENTDVSTEEETETEVFGTSFTATSSDGRAEITVTTSEDAEIPEDAALVAEYLDPDSDDYAAAAAKIESQLGSQLGLDKDGAEAAYVLYDVSFVCDGEEIEPNADVTVKMTFSNVIDLGIDGEIISKEVVHLTDDKVAEIVTEYVYVTEDGILTAFEFTQDDFSVVGAVVTSVPAEEESESESEEETETEEATEAGTEVETEVESEDNSISIAEAASNGGIMLAESGNAAVDLTSFLSSITIKNSADGTAIEAVEGVYQVNNPFYIGFTFSEGNASQQFTGNEFTYTLPSDFTAATLPTGGFTGTFDIDIEEDNGNGTTTKYTVSGNTYSITTDANGQLVLTITFNTEDTNYQHLLDSTNVSFYVTLEATLSETTTSTTISFGNSIEKTVEVSGGGGSGDTSSVTIEKYGEIKDDGKVYYTLTVTSTGANTNIVVSDSYSSSIISGVNDLSVKEDYWPYDDVSYTINSKTDSGFNLTIDSMTNGQIVKITYSADIDYSKITVGQSETLVNNDVEVTSDEDTTSETDSYENKISYDWISKPNLSDSDIQYVDEKATMTWEIIVNPEKKVSVAGSAITICYCLNFICFIAIQTTNLNIIYVN